MKVNRLPYLLLIAVFLHSALVADGAVGPGTSESAASAGPSTVSGGGGGGSRLPDVDSFIRQVEYWKANYKDRFDYLQSLLYKPNFTTTKYVPPAVWLYYPSKNNAWRIDNQFYQILMSVSLRTERTFLIASYLYRPFHLKF